MLVVLFVLPYFILFMFSLFVWQMLDGAAVVTKEVLLTGEYVVRLANNHLCHVHPSSMTKLQQLSHKKGDVVRMIDDMSQVYKLQEGHGEWTDDMALVGVVVSGGVAMRVGVVSMYVIVVSS